MPPIEDHCCDTPARPQLRHGSRIVATKGDSKVKGEFRGWVANIEGFYLYDGESTQTLRGTWNIEVLIDLPTVKNTIIVPPPAVPGMQAIVLTSLGWRYPETGQRVDDNTVRSRIRQGWQILTPKA